MCQTLNWKIISKNQNDKNTFQTIILNYKHFIYSQVPSNAVLAYVPIVIKDAIFFSTALVVPGVAQMAAKKSLRNIATVNSQPGLDHNTFNGVQL